MVDVLLWVVTRLSSEWEVLDLLRAGVDHHTAFLQPFPGRQEPQSWLLTP